MCNATSPVALRRAEVGDTPRSPPRPGPPHLHRAAPCSAPGRPPRSTGEPPGSSPLGHSERPGGTRPRLRGAPSGADPARPEWAVQLGGGVPGASPPPGRGHAQAPRVTRVPPGARWHCTAGLRVPPSQVGWLCVWGFGRLRTRQRQQVTLYSNRGSGASGGWSLLEHKGPGAVAAALPPLLF